MSAAPDLLAVLRALVRDAPQVECQNMHHAKADMHEWNQPCKPLERWQAALDAADAAIAKAAKP